MNLSSRFASLSPEKRALLDLFLRGSIVERRELPLSYAQERLWFIDQLEPGSTAYNIPSGVRLEGRLDQEALKRSVREMVRRHEVLRTRIEVQDGRGIQVIEPEWKESLEVVDLRGEAEREAEVVRLAEEEATRPFDLREGPLLRVVLVQLGEEDHVLLVTMHHIISDGWSVGILIREFAALYEAFAKGEESPLPELGIQYADYAVWQREWLQGEVLEEQLGYWKGQLDGVPPLELPTDHPRPLMATHQGGHVPFSLSVETTEKLKGLCREQGVTLFMVLLAAFEVMLGRWAGQQDVAVGTDIANRHYLETESLIGFFVNQLVLRIQWKDNPSFTELLGRVRQTVLGAYEHQDLPFEKLVEELEPDRSLNRSPLFQVKLVLQNAPEEELQMFGLRLGPFDTGSESTKVDLHLMVDQAEDILSGELSYSADLFEAATVERMLGHWERLLEEMAEDPGRRISELEMLSETERQQISVEWNETEQSYPEASCIQQMFEEQVKRTPDAVAVVYEEEQVTYEELNGRANQLAHYLQLLGVGPEVRVALCGDRSIEMLIGLWGVLKAGGVYIPLDPRSPSQRLASMLDDAKIAVILTQQKQRDALPAHWAQVICLDADWDEIGLQSSKGFPALADTGNLAYAIYTSGSSGQPKAVAIEHRQLLHYVQAISAQLRMGECDRFALASTLTADLGYTVLYSALTTGGTLHLVPEWLRGDVADYLAYRAVDCLKITPSHLRVLMSDEKRSAVLPWRRLVLGGEVSIAEWVQSLYELRSGCQVWNHYGPTECTVGAATYAVPSEGRIEGTLPIGRPIANTKVYVVDERMGLVPVGVAGELYIGGAGLARGYLNRPELTAEKFVPDPFGSKGGERLYRTGDRVKWRADGNLEFLGRVDEQVKIRGYRIEPGEIEAVLREHAGVRDTVVMAREDEPGEKRLVGYVVKQMGAEELSASELRSYLQGRLPDYMVPSLYVVLEGLPLTPNGKVDRKALPVPGLGQSEQERYVAPRTPTEEILCGIWAKVLGLERVGVEDNFFELGGHSLLATQVVSRIRSTFQVDLPLRVLFEGPTVAGVTKEVEQARQEERALKAPVLNRVERERELPLSYAQERLWFIDQLEPGSTAYNIPSGVRLEGRLDQEALKRSVREMVRRHEVLRTRIEVQDGRGIQVIEPEWKESLEVVDLRGEAEREAEVVRLAEEEATRPFDLREGPLLRVVLVQLGEEDHVLLVTMHHIISDGWSVGILIREFAALYEAFAKGEESPLPELGIQYADYAVWQREWLQGEVLEEQLGYWKGQLDGVPPLELPTDHPRPLMATHQGGHVPFSLSVETTEKLKGLCREQGVTLFMVLLAAFEVMLGRWAGQQDVAVGTDIANRHYLETESLIGFFVNQLVLRIQWKDNPSFTELLGRVRQTVLGAYEHQDLPFEKLVEELEPDRSLNRSPLFQVKLVLQNAPEGELQLTGLHLKGISTEQGMAKLDLTLLASESAGVLSGSIEYSRDLFEAATVERMLGHWERLLEEMAEDPGRRISELEMLSETERQQISVEWNETEQSYPEASCIQQMFEEQVKRTPDAVAVVYEEEQVTYEELNGRANQLAHYLQTLGVGAEVRVGICVERSLEMAVGLLGILKAGGAYVPLDPEYPAERLAFMLEDAQVAVLLTQSWLRERLPVSWAQVFCLDSDWLQTEGQSTENGPVMMETGNAAYVIYTSGTTGRPKGVVITHGGLTNYLSWGGATYPSKGEFGGPVHSSIGFDFTVTVLYLLIINGNRLVLLREERGVEELTTILSAPRKFDLLKLTPAHLDALSSSLCMEGLRGPARAVVIGGEALSQKQVAPWRQYSPGIRLINEYGPTETVVGCCVYEMGEEEPLSGSVPIGRPIANTKVYVVDERMGLVPVGVAGELYIGGAGLARGYLNRPELTAEKFVPDPFGSKGGERLYRTGDRVKWRADGNLEFLGRVDEQVKIRGYRIEPGEIEAVLREHAGVRDTVVMAREDEPGEKRLVGYVVKQMGAEELSASELRSYLQGRLPDYMVPSLYVVLEGLPLTPNGKVDRKALPVPGLGQSEQECYVAPRTPTEEILCGIWAKVLGLERVGVEDNFFELGGHSLLATQVVSRIRSTFQVDLPLRVLFEGPTVAGVTKEVEQARQEERALKAPVLNRVERERELPLSYAQERLWFIDQLEPGSTAYNIPSGVRLEGRLDQEALKRSVREMVRRHEVLRTRIEVQDGRGIQVIEPEWKESLEVVDLRGEAEREAEVVRLAEEEATRPFDLREGPLLRVVLVQLGEEDHVLLVTMHHIISDGWSVGILIREFAALYEAFAKGEESPLPELGIQYADYAVWQREWLQGEVLEEQLGYWKGQLDGVPPLELPTDHPRPLMATHQGGHVPFSLSAETTEKLKGLCREQGVTLFMVLLAAFEVMLGRWAGQQDVAVGTDIANRHYLETESLIGFFVNQLVLRIQWKDNPSFTELLGRVRQTVLGAYEHQDLPFEKLVEELEPDRSLNRSPLFQVKLVLQNAPEGELQLTGLHLKGISTEQGMAKLDLTLLASESAGVLSGSIEYSRDLFEAATVERMLGHWERLLEEMAEDPGRRISELEMLSETERQQISVEWNETEQSYPEASCIQQMFEEQVKRTPDAVAVVYEEEQVTYEELNGRANQLAHYLQTLGVGAEVRVGICVERSLEMAVGLLGILKAGGAYVPLDPEYPAERLAFMLEDAQVAVLLTQSWLHERLPETAARFVELDIGCREIVEQSKENLPCITDPKNTAYVIYTSGSSGNPKGTCVTQRNVVNHMEWMLREFPLNSSERVLQKTTLAFDASFWEFFGPWLRGASVVLLLRGRRQLDSVLHAIAINGITRLQFIPSAMDALLMLKDVEANTKTLCHVFCGGESLSAKTPSSFFARSRANLHNIYGPTETTIISSFYRIDLEDVFSSSVPIGRPIANTKVYVVDERMGLVPVGVAGELYIGGAGLARGYLNRPELTAEKFVPDPFGSKGGERLYRTGDRVKWRADGNLEFLGRVDEQVKIRGYRIEPGEIEAVLREHAGVRDTVVMAREDEPGEKRLVGYVVKQMGAEELSASELRSYLQGRLPDYMVPSLYVVLEGLPLTPNGKVDRKALPVPGLGQSEQERYVAPRTPTEEILCGIWAKVLGLERVGVEDNFFELGGHSLLATQVVSRIRSTFQVDLPLRVLFEGPTVAGVTKEVEQARQEERALKAPVLNRVERERELPLSYAQERLWFIDQLEPGSTAYNIPSGVRLEGRLDQEALKRSVREMVRRHEVLRTRIEVQDGRGIQVIEPEWKESLEVVDLRGEAEREAEVVRLAEEEATRPFDLREGPLLRVVLVQLGEEDHVLLVTMHHIISDGWSVGILIREFAALYEAFAKGEESPLPELGIQYADYAVWQREWLQGEVLEEQLGYWKGQLDGVPPLELPTDHPRPLMATHQGGHVPFSLSVETTEKLKGLCREQGVTLFMVLLAAFEVMLGRWAGQQDVAVGTDIANRHYLETESLIGFFVNQLVLRIQWKDNPSFTELLGRVRQTVLGAYEHQDLPFEKLVEELEPDRSLNRSPLFQVKLVLQNAPEEELQMFGLRLGPFDTGSESTKVDLHLMVDQAEDILSGELSYSADLFEAATVERMLGHWERLLEEMAEDPGRRISELEMLSETERQQISVEWNETEQSYPEASCIQQMFEEQVKRTPDAVAVVYEEEQVTYEELNGRANQLAHYLQLLGVGPEVRVALCGDRSIEMLIGLWGVLKAGGVYIPLDPRSPSQRLASMLDDAKIAVILTQQKQRDALPAHWAQVICLDADWDEIGLQSSKGFPALADTGNLAYAIYTSGSSGQPKAVAIEHRQLLHYVQAISAQLRMGECDRFALASTLTADLGYTVLYSALTTGGTLHLVPEWLRGDVADYLAYRAVDCLKITPSHLRVLMSDEKRSAVLPWRRLVLGGEVSIAEWVQSLYELRSGCQVWNHYGPTECTVGAATYAVPSEGRIEGTLPIGRPIANTKVYVVDERMGLVPVGVAGELYIGGAGLARGYLNRPELTAEKFVPDPFGSKGGERLYRTGDRVKWRADGNLEFLGRVDEQVKIRGYRIEPGEIEAVLREHAGVRDTVVMAREDEPGEKRLVGYVVKQMGAEELSASELRSYLQGRLPDYMVPSLYVVLEGLPLTPNGKVDRKALPVPGLGQSEQERYVAPRTPTEEILCGIWAKVLGLERVGVEDNFFELGGHSLLATQVVSRIRSTFQVDLPLRVLFEGPTVAGVTKEVEQARQEERALKAPVLNRVERERELPLSYAQERLWFIDQLEPGSTAYNIPSGVRLEGRLDQEALKRSVREMVRRHEVLRTRIEVQDGRGIQVIEPEWKESLEVVDLRGEAEREAEVVRLAEEEATRPFDLREGPLLRVVLVQLGEEDHVLLVTMHHIISDGWSVGILIREFAALYEAFAKGEESPLPELGIQYADYAVWQREWLQGEVLEEQLGYWKGQLDGVPPLELPTDHPRPLMATHQGGHVPFSLSVETTEKLKGLCREQGVTLFMVLLAAFEVMLGRWAGQQDVAVGTDIANRHYLETESLIGFFVNQLVLRIQWKDNPSFTELLGRVRQTVLGAYEHQDLPFEKLVEELEPDRSLNRSPLFQVKLVLQNAPEGELQLTGLHLKGISTEQGMAKLDLTLLASESAGVLSGSIEYSRDLFEAATVERMLGHWERLLEEMAEDPGRRISELEMLSETERQQISVEWNETEQSYPEASCIQQMFEEQVKRTPDAVAVVYEEEQVTYEELNGRANQLAHYLQTLGVGAEVRVGICVERSLEMAVGLLGILKAGGAYVPLDPEYPAERLAFMLEDAQVAVLLTQSWLRERLPVSWAQVFCLDSDWLQTEGQSTENGPVMMETGNAAYVIYTSGTTGRPKGVVITHASLRNLICAEIEALGIEVNKKVLQFASLSFDASVWEWSATLAVGARLILTPKEAILNGVPLQSLLTRNAVEIVTLPPSILGVLGEADLPALQTLVIAGETCTSVVTAHENAGRRMLNAYGPTEGTICTTISDQLDDWQNAPIGRPIANTKVYVVDERMGLVPVGVAGELYIGGAGLARGYLNRPELTAEKFVPDPFGSKGGERLYRTGDRVKWRADGNLEFLGRVDEQVKIRGYRIEPGEIEAVLREHAGVRDTVVMAREDEPGEKRLVGYVVKQMGAEELSASELRSYLQGRLPDYMVPSLYVVLEGLPLTPNGKVDRKALPVPGLGQSEQECYVAPRTPTEEILCGIWAKVLGLERVGVEDNFFELGGHSLLATQVVSRIRSTFQVDLPLRVLFEGPTIERLGISIEEALLDEIEQVSEQEATKLINSSNNHP